jgi:hypothetical protein
LLVAGMAAPAMFAALLVPATTAQGQPSTASGQPSAAAPTVVAPPAPAAASLTGRTRTVTKPRIATVAATPRGTVGAPAAPELRPKKRQIKGSSAGKAPGGTAAAGSAGRVLTEDRIHGRRLPNAQRTGVTGQGPVAKATIIRTGARLGRNWHGLDHYDNRTADNGNQFSNEPPDQALCVGKGYVVEGVNTVMRVNRTNGTKGPVVSLNRFFGQPSAFVRPAGPTGPNVFDPSCVYDPSTGTFYFVAAHLGTDPATGNYTGQALLDIAVTQNPAGAWKIYQLDVTNDGRNGSPVHAGCPCFGDFPHIGFDAYGFYISTNEFPLFEAGYNGAQIYAFNKRQLIAGTGTIRVTEFNTAGADEGNSGFTVWPARSPHGRDFSLKFGGTEYFLSSNAVFNESGSSSSLVVWSMVGTSTLGTANPRARLNHRRVAVQQYAVPPVTQQRPGPAPLLECLNSAACRPNLTDTPLGEPEKLAALDSSDSRMFQVNYARGKLYSSLNTAVRFGEEVQAGIAWYVLGPSTALDRVAARVVNQGQVGLPGHGLLYPAVGVTTEGRGVMGFSLAGKNWYPSAAFMSIDASGVGPIRMAALGKGPQDGFTGYREFGGEGVARWGDYSMASAVGNEVWFATEYINQRCTLEEYTKEPFGTCDKTRTALANWGTRISQVLP